MKHYHKVTNSVYPIPFSKDFYQELTRLPYQEITSSANLNLKKINKKYSYLKTVILIKIIHQERNFLLDELADWILANSIIEKITEFHEVQKIKSNGSLGIFVCDKNKVAINFAKDLRENLNGLFTVSIGLCRGNVLIFDLGKDVFEIAGDPVNVASKIAEDSGEKNCILVESSVKCDDKNCKAFTYNISHIDISGVKI